MPRLIYFINWIICVKMLLSTLTFIYEKKTEEIEKFVYLNYQKTLVSLLKIKVEKV